MLAGYCAATAILYKRFWAQDDFWAAPDGKGRSLLWDFLKNVSLGVGFLLLIVGTRRVAVRRLHRPAVRVEPSVRETLMSDPGARPAVPYWHLHVDGDGVSRQTQCALIHYELAGVGPADPQWNDKQARGEAVNRRGCQAP